MILVIKVFLLDMLKNVLSKALMNLYLWTAISIGDHKLESDMSNFVFYYVQVELMNLYYSSSMSFQVII